MRERPLWPVDLDELEREEDLERERRGWIPVALVVISLVLSVAGIGGGVIYSMLGGIIFGAVPGYFVGWRHAGEREMRRSGRRAYHARLRSLAQEEEMRFLDEEADA